MNVLNSDGLLLHSARRGAERYGFELDNKEYAALSVQIAFHELTGEDGYVRLSNAGGGREKWAVWFKGEWIPVVFDTLEGRIVTLLPGHELRRFRYKLPW